MDHEESAEREMSILTLTPLHKAVDKNHYEVSEILLAVGADPNARTNVRDPLCCLAVLSNCAAGLPD